MKTTHIVAKKPHLSKNINIIPIDGGLVRKKNQKKSNISIYEMRERVIFAIQHYKNKKNEVIGIEGILQAASPNAVLRFLGKILPKDIHIDNNQKRVIINLNYNMKDI